MPSAQPSLIGATIGNYRVVSKLGEGGMGAVYLAEHPLIGKKVALKVLHPELSTNPDVTQRFFNEARAVNEIGHPNIVDVVDYGVLEQEGRPRLVYFIMELLLGESLSAVLAREAPLPTERALRIAVQIGDALAASHEKGVIHRDLKPDNVFLLQRREADFVKVLDFGIAKLTGGSHQAGDIKNTRTGVVMGTPAYMSPEQCEGKRGVDKRSDVYALGVILYEMITGQVPFTGEGYGEVLMQHMTTAPIRPSTIRGVIPPPVEAIVMKALEKKRERRFGSMQQMVLALRDPARFASGKYPTDYTDQPSQRATTVPETRRSRVAEAFTPTVSAGRPTTLSSSAAELGVRPRSRMPVIFASALIVLSGLAAGAYFMLRQQAEHVEPEAPVAVAPPSPAPPPPAPEPVPAPVPTPPPVIEPAAPLGITVSVTSVPPGADVYVGLELRGKTPLVMQLPRADGDIPLVLKLDGYKDKIKTVRANRDTELEVMLERRSRRREPEVTPPQPPAETPPVTPTKPRTSEDEEILPPTF